MPRMARVVEIGDVPPVNHFLRVVNGPLVGHASPFFLMFVLHLCGSCSGFVRCLSDASLPGNWGRKLVPYLRWRKIQNRGRCPVFYRNTSRFVGAPGRCQRSATRNKLCHAGLGTANPESIQVGECSYGSSRLVERGSPNRDAIPRRVSSSL